MSLDCVFCKISKGEAQAEKVYEDDQFVAFLDIQPVSLGHTLVVSKIHTPNILEAPSEILSNMILLSKQIGRAVVAATGAEGFNLHINNGPAAGQVIAHLHFHIIPRHSNDHLKLWSGDSNLYKKDSAKAIASSIRELL